MFLATFMTIPVNPYRVPDVIIGSKSENLEVNIGEIPTESHKSSKPFKPSKQFYSDAVVYPVRAVQPLSYSTINNQLKYETDTSPYTINSQLKGSENTAPLSGENTSGAQETSQIGPDNEGQVSETISYVKPLKFYDQKTSHYDLGGEQEGTQKKKEVHYHQHKHLHEHDHKQEHLHKHKQEHVHQHQHGHNHGDKHQHQHQGKHEHHHKDEHGHKHEGKHQHVHQGM